MENICEIISREKIKPSSPTPQHNRVYDLSWFDQISHRSFIPILLFFDKPINQTISSQTYDLLKTSLSLTLTKYYPFAGRIRDQVSILCDDEGVDFIEAEFKPYLSSVLENPRSETLDLLFPDNLQWRFAEEPNAPLLAVQVNYFRCGGVALGVCLSHKLADAATLASFLAFWSKMARNSDDVLLWEPPLNAATIFPRGVLPLYPEPTRGDHSKQESCVTKRFLFKKVVKSHDDGGSSCTRVETITSLLFRTAVKVSEKINLRHTLYHQVNLRPRTVPKLPENIVGNVVGFVPVVAPCSASQLREALAKSCGKFFRRFRGDIDVQDWCLAMKECLDKSKSSTTDCEAYVCTSWCRFPVYEVDFGWGGPVWVTTAGTVDKNVFVLMDTKCGVGIEATVTLEEKEMCSFECDQELLQYVTLIK